MKLSNSVYDILKWITMIVIPALATAYVGLAAVWGWPCADKVAKTAAIVCTLLGTLLGISTAQYNRDVGGAAGQIELDTTGKEEQGILCGRSEPDGQE